MRAARPRAREPRRASPGARGCAASLASVRARIGGRHAIPRRRSPFDFTVLRVVAWVSCPHRSPDRRSPLKCTAFRVIAERAIHSRIGAAVRSICRRSPSECTAFRVVMGGFCPQPNRPPHPLACRCSPSELTGFLVCGCARGAPNPHASAAAAPALYSIASRTPLRTIAPAQSTRNPVHWTGERHRRIKGRRPRGCGYPASASTRSPVDLNGERLDPLDGRADCVVDNPPPDDTRNAVQSTGERPPAAGRCGYPAPATNSNAVHFTGEDARDPPRKPLPRGLARTCRCSRGHRLASWRRCAPARLGMRCEPPSGLRQNSLNSAAKPAQSFSLRRRVSKMRKNFLAFPRKNRAIPLLAAGVVRRRGARPGTAQSTSRRHPP